MLALPQQKFRKKSDEQRIGKFMVQFIPAKLFSIRIGLFQRNNFARLRPQVFKGENVVSKTNPELPENPGFMDAIRAYFFFTRRYVLVFYAVLLFAAFFAILISFVSIALVFLNMLTGGDDGGEFRFTLMVLIFFGIGFQALMAFASIAYNLWNITFQQNDLKREFPATRARVKMLRAYFDSSNNFITKLLTFLIPSILTTLILVVPLFGLVVFLVSLIEIGQPTPTFLRDIFIPDSFLVGLSVFVMNLNYYLETRLVKKA